MTRDEIQLWKQSIDWQLKIQLGNPCGKRQVLKHCAVFNVAWWRSVLHSVLPLWL